MKIQSDAVNAYSNLCKVFEDVPLTFVNKSNSWYVQSDFNNIYPKDYSGEYIDLSGCLHLYTTSEPDDVFDKYEAWCGMSDKLILHKVVYTLMELENLQYAISQSGIKNISSIGVDTQENKVLVSIHPDYFAEIRLQVIDRFDENMIMFDKMNYTSYESNPASYKPDSQLPPASVYATYPLRPGTRICSAEASTGDTVPYTVGMVGKYKNKTAILTCGHAFLSASIGTPVDYTVNQTISTAPNTSSSISLGSLSKCQYQNRGYGDYAFVTVSSSSFDILSTTANGIKLSGYSETISNGQLVYKYGKATGSCYGTIALKNATVGDTNIFGETIYIYGLNAFKVYTNVYPTPCAVGDSGGPVYHSDSGNYLIDGTIAGFSGNVSEYYLVYYSPIAYAVANEFQPTF